MASATVTTTKPKTDEQIQRDVLEELKWDARVQPNEIGVTVKDGVVTLTGWVDSYAKKWAVTPRSGQRSRRPTGCAGWSRLPTTSRSGCPVPWSVSTRT